MPKSFMNAVKQGAHVRTIHAGKNKCVRVAFKNGKSYAGEAFKCKAKKRGVGKKKR